MAPEELHLGRKEFGYKSCGPVRVTPGYISSIQRATLAGPQKISKCFSTKVALIRRLHHRGEYHQKHCIVNRV
jgi:hypothetical protein